MPTSISEDSRKAASAVKPLRLRDRGRIATHQKLLDVGMKMFLDKGFASTTAAKIAKEAEVSVGTFYVHFKDKEALLLEAWQQYFDEEVGRLLAIANPEDENRPELIDQRVRANADALLRWAEERPQEFLFWTGPEVATTVVRRKIDQTMSDWIEKSLIEEGDLGNALVDGVPINVAAQAIIGICNRVLRWWLSNPAAARREGVVSTLARLHFSLYSVSEV